MESAGYFCECANRGCLKKLDLTNYEYMALMKKYEFAATIQTLECPIRKKCRVLFENKKCRVVSYRVKRTWLS